MALGPIDMAGGMSPQAHGGGQLSAELLDARIERLLQVLNRGDLTPAQRENTLRALTALQRERTLLQAFSQSEPSSATAAGRESPLTSAQRGAAAMATASTGQAVSRVTLGEHGRMLSEMANVERALEVKEGADKLFSSLGKSTLQADPLRSPLENQVIVTSQLVVPPEGAEDDPPPVTSVLNPQPVFGFIPAQWIPGSVRAQARSPATLLLIGIVILLMVIVLIW
ncbi:3-phytase [Edwardsiella piscicida]|uniref:3-phytase n=1 Tax=Edwardsiella piscicida TaxID=1263550 RepID=UPI000932E4DC|nr:3-phytase [Edwardsiella piscicida]EKS7778904.1 3-phytase [Edwardsiella piscicida]EKS7782324.1 3-phytase [Edwardsiella piscicida]EKS7812091.1 3-phytase [Edwardsiella piscicida]UCQ22147.1 3-phytase [Edwardsiella piscicida]UCQ25488.1 3-phytase [Edwardsiella piscicida]